MCVGGVFGSTEHYLIQYRFALGSHQPPAGPVTILQLRRHLMAPRREQAVGGGEVAVLDGTQLEELTAEQFWARFVAARRPVRCVL